MEEFNIVEYLHRLQRELKATTGYEFCRISDPKNMEEVIQGCKRKDRFFAVDDSQEGMIFASDGDGWFERRPVVVFLLGRLSRWPDMDGRANILVETRAIYHKLVARLLRDRDEYEELIYLNTDSIPYDEIPGQFSGGTSGIFFTFTIDVPVNLEYDESDWQ